MNFAALLHFVASFLGVVDGILLRLALVYLVLQAWDRATRFADAVIDWVKADAAKRLAEGKRALREGPGQ